MGKLVFLAIIFSCAFVLNAAEDTYIKTHEKKICDALVEHLHNVSHSSSFRPSTPTYLPTKIMVSLESFRVLNFTETEKNKDVELITHLNLEYSDTRLNYEKYMPTEVKDKIKYLFVRNELYELVWEPEIIFPKALDPSYTEQYSKMEDLYSSKFLLSPTGDIFHRKKVHRELASVSSTIKDGNLSFKFFISEGKYPMRDVVLAWKEKNPVKVEEDLIETPDGRVFKVEIMQTGMCKRIEDLGKLGKDEFGCLEFEFMMRPKK
jgi:hypothetical protein